ncbi:MAG TPA: SigE family RNA polymerase sigma factor [Acidimicrobiales bacterium]|nr:SigE family RNA polymerase sigma factor [Acidimicrobiales bacterium]
MSVRPGRDELVSTLFDEHYPGLCRLASLLLGDPAEAEEVVQEAFLKTYARWWRLRHPERAQWYLRAAVVNGCRSKGRRRVSEDRGNRTLWATDGVVAAEAVGERTGEALAVVAAVRALPDRQREAVVLRYYEDLSEADIAQALGCSVGTVKSQLSKARATLARHLSAQGLGDDPT